MKIKHIFLFGSLCVLGSVAMSSCSEDETYDVDGGHNNVVFFNPYNDVIQQNEVYVTPAGAFGLAGGSFEVKSQYATSSSITVTGEIDNSLVAQFNKEHGEEGKTYHELPATLVDKVQITKATIPSGSNLGENELEVSLSSEDCTGLTEEYYVMPIRMKLDNVDKGDSQYTPELRDTFNTVYAVVHNAGSDFIYTNNDYEQSAAVVITPVGTFGGINNTFNCYVRANKDASFTMTGKVDNSLIAAYNEENGTEYEQLPEEVLNHLVITQGTIPSGELSTNPGLNVSCDVEYMKDLKGSYLVPLKLSFVYPNGTTVDLPNGYIVVSVKTSFINDDASEITGTALDNSTWSLVDCDNFDPDAFDPSSWSSWSGWDILEKKSSASFTLDAGKVVNMIGFYTRCYVANGATLSVSEDGTNWTEIGSTNGHNYVYKYDRSTWTYYYEYVLYGAVKARYFKFTYDLDTSSYYWRYQSWGYCAAMSNTIYVQ